MQFGVSSLLVAAIFGLQTWQWRHSLEESRRQWGESLATSTEQWREALNTANEQWRQEGPVIQAVDGASALSGETHLEISFENGTYRESRAPYKYGYVVSNTGRSEATILSISLLSADGNDTILPHMCVEGGFPTQLSAGASMVVGGRSIGAIYAGGTIRVLLASGVSQHATALPLADPSGDAEAFREFYGSSLESVAQSCDPVDFLSPAPGATAPSDGKRP